MLARPLRWASLLLTGAVLLGFALFAIDQVDSASRTQRDRIAGVRRADPDRRQEQARERRHGAVREAIDDVNDVLLRPFAELTDARNPWVHRLVPLGLALLVYGLGLSMLATLVRGRLRWVGGR